MAVKTVYLAFIWSLIVLISANDETISYNSPEVCGEILGYRKEIPVCSSEREERRLNVNLDCNQTTVSVTFNDPGLDVNEISRREVRLSCSGLDNDQSITNCSGTVSGNSAEYNDKVIFYNLMEAGIHPGSTCTISGCFKEDAGPYFRSQTETCTLPTDPTTTAQQTTMPTTTMATTTMATTTMATTTMATTTMATTTMATTTMATTTSETFTSDPVTSGSTNSSHVTAENEGPDPTSAIVATLIVLFATLSLITIIIIYVVWMKKRRYRKMALSFGDKKIMIFDPTYTPRVSIDKPAKNYYSHRLSFISLDLHQYLQPYGEFTTDFYGSQKLKSDSEYKDHIDNGDSVTIEVDKCSMESTRESSRSVLPHSSLIGPQTLKANADEAMVTIHKHAMTSTGSCGYVLDEVTTPTHNWSTTTDNLSELTLKSGAVSNYITGAQYGDVLCTTEQEQNQELGEDTLSILLAEDTPESTLAVGDINLDQPQSSHDSEYVQSNTAASNALSAFPNESPFELDLEETKEESYNGHQNLTSVSLSTRFETTGYLDSNLLTRSFEPAVAIPEQEKLTEHQTGNPLTHLTNTEGYVQDTETPPPSYADNESLDLTFDTDSGNDLTFEPKQQGEEELPSHHHDNTTPDLTVDNTCDLDTPHAPPPNITTPGYVRCEDIITNELPTREIVVPAGLISPSEAAESANFTVHLDFDEGMKSHPNPVELTSGHSNPGMNKVMYKLSTSQPNKQPWQLSEDDTTTFARAIAKEHYVSYDISSAEELSLSYSPDDPDPMWVSTNTSPTPSPTVNTQQLSNYYPPSDVSSGYLSASSTTGDANSYL